MQSGTMGFVSLHFLSGLVSNFPSLFFCLSNPFRLRLNGCTRIVGWTWWLNCFSLSIQDSSHPQVIYLYWIVMLFSSKITKSNVVVSFLILLKFSDLLIFSSLLNIRYSYCWEVLSGYFFRNLLNSMTFKTVL